MDVYKYTYIYIYMNVYTCTHYYQKIYIYYKDRCTYIYVFKKKLYITFPSSVSFPLDNNINLYILLFIFEMLLIYI